MFHLVSPLPSIYGFNTPVFFFFLSIIPSSIFTFTIGNPPPPARTYNLSLPCVFLASYFIIICYSNPNVQHVFFFFISASKISPRIKIYNMNLCAESTESILLIKIQGLNNCMFGKLINIFFLFNRAYFFLVCNIYFLSVTQNCVKRASQNIYVQHLRENSKSASTKRGIYCGNEARIKTENWQRDTVIRRLVNRDLKNN